MRQQRIHTPVDHNNSHFGSGGYVLFLIQFT